MTKEKSLWDWADPGAFREFMTHSREWIINGGSFAVQVSHADLRIEAMFDPPGGSSSWQVYATVYPQHPSFAALMRGDFIPSNLASLPLRRDGRYLQRQLFGLRGDVEAYIIGASYWSADDGRFRDIRPDSPAADEVFADAMALYKWMEYAAEHAAP